uniref:Uncharacterized protein n=1 Tax=Oryza punctata TaxID=4537 RepID=A0A0E0L9F7_ORYPU
MAAARKSVESGKHQPTQPWQIRQCTRLAFLYAATFRSRTVRVTCSYWGKFLYTWTRLVHEIRRNKVDGKTTYFVFMGYSKTMSKQNLTSAKIFERLGLEMEPTGKIVGESSSFQAVGSP